MNGNERNPWEQLEKNHLTFAEEKQKIDDEIATLENSRKSDRITQSVFSERKQALDAKIEERAVHFRSMLENIQTQVMEQLESKRTLDYSKLDQGDLFLLQNMDMTASEVEKMAMKYQDNITMKRFIKIHCKNNNLQVNHELFQDGEFEHEKLVKHFNSCVSSYRYALAHYKNRNSWRLHSMTVTSPEFKNGLPQGLPYFDLEKFWRNK